MYAASAADVRAFGPIERAAGGLFRDVGMPEVADDQPLAVTVLNRYQQDGRAFAAVLGGSPAAYLLVERVDGWAHIAQVSVHPKWSRRGIGAALIDRAQKWAIVHQLTGLSLTTFADVPWNAPYYRRLGFTDRAPEMWGPGLTAVVSHETSLGLDRWPRVSMVRPNRPTRGDSPARKSGWSSPR